jgi:hypothetical protein
MSKYAIEPLGAATWDAFAQLAERHNGVWNGCWCTWFHPASAEKRVSPEGNRAFKQRLVLEGRPTRPWSSTVTSPLGGVNSVLRLSCRASTT